MYLKCYFEMTVTEHDQKTAYYHDYGTEIILIGYWLDTEIM